MSIDLATLNEIARRTLEGEYTLFLSIFRTARGHENCSVTLEKGSTYGKFHMRVEGKGDTPSEAFEAALRQFPSQPLDGIAKWDTSRISGPVTDGDFTELNKENSQ